MDDLIRQAADEYPLKTGGNDWEKVAAGMQATIPKEPSNHKKYWWLLLLLLPLLIAVPLYYQNKSIQKHDNNSIAKTTDTAARKQDVNSLSDKENKAPEQVTTEGIAASQANRTGSTKKQNDVSTNNHFTTDITAAIGNKNAVSASSVNGRRNQNTSEKDALKFINNTNSSVTNGLADNTNRNNNLSFEKSHLSTIKNVPDTAAIVNKEIQKNNAEKESTPAATIHNDDNKATIISQKDSATTAKKTNSKHTSIIKRKGLYAGAAAGLDATMVKFNEVNKIGNSASLIVGYRMNNTWSVETGLMWDNKNYYSPGEYFNKSNTGLSADYNIHYLNGNCKMFEIPLNIKYDFISKRSSGFFVTAGLSSYIMKKEGYNYFVTHDSNPTEPGYYKQKDYRNATNNFFSVANISGGYQFIFKNNNSLRIEPYLKVPLKGLGIGKLPFSSTGISAAYTLPLH